MTRRKERVAEADRLRQEGMTPNQIAASMGISKFTVYGYLSEAERERHGAKIDKRHKALSELPEEVRRWLTEITPEGATVSDTIRAIITDAYSEEKGIDRASGSV